MVTKALYVPLKPKEGQEQALEEFLGNGLGLAQEEPETVTWYAFKQDDGTYAIFDTFDADEGRQAHLNGKVAEALQANADTLLAEAPQIHQVDVLGAKIPGRE